MYIHTPSYMHGRFSDAFTRHQYCIRGLHSPLQLCLSVYLSIYLCVYVSVRLPGCLFACHPRIHANTRAARLVPQIEHVQTLRREHKPGHAQPTPGQHPGKLILNDALASVSFCVLQVPLSLSALDANSMRVCVKRYACQVYPRCAALL